MRKFLAIPAMAALISGCGIVEVRAVPPEISNLETQATFCTDRDTIVDFRFEAKGLITKLEVWVTQAEANDPAANPNDKVGELDAFDLFQKGSKLVGFIALDTNGDNRVQRSGRDWPAIVVTPTDKQLWLRAYNFDQTKGFVKAANPISPSAQSDCDPIFPYGQP
jgi:hypothetical protein